MLQGEKRKAVAIDIDDETEAAPASSANADKTAAARAMALLARSSRRAAAQCAVARLAASKAAVPPAQGALQTPAKQRRSAVERAAATSEFLTAMGTPPPIYGRQNIRGESVTKEQSEAVVTLLHGFGRVAQAPAAVRAGWLSLAKELACRVVGVSKPIVDRIADSLISEGELYSTAETRGAPVTYTKEMVERAAAFVRERYKFGAATNKHILCRLFGEGSDGGPPQYVGIDTARCLMRDAGMTFRTLKNSMNSYFSSDRFRAQLVRYTLLLSVALKEEQEGKAIICWMDESYIDSFEHATKGYAGPGDKMDAPKGRGKRIIIVHAMSKYGMCVDHGDTMLPLPVDVQAFETPWKTCEGLFVDTMGVGADDYHKTMSSELFLRWVVNRLLVWRDAYFPGLRLYLVLDNAAYHAEADKNTADFSSTASRSGMVATLARLGCTELTITRKEGETESSFVVNPRDPVSIGERKSATAPSADELRAAGKEWVKKNKPEEFANALQRILAGANGVALYLPPYACEAMPIELVWGIGKSGARMKYRFGITPDDVIQNFRETLYTDNHLGQHVRSSGRLQVNPVAQNVIDHSMRELQRILEERYPEFASVRGPMGTWTAGSGDASELERVNAWVRYGGATNENLDEVRELSLYHGVAKEAKARADKEGQTEEVY